LVEPPPELEPAARRLFGDRLPVAVAYAGLLGGGAIERGLIGPHEGPRVWDRHLLNCAVVEELIPQDARVVDVGSGAGLPGIVLAVARPDLTVILVESLARRTAFLSEAVTALGLDRVTVVRARAEECVPGGDGSLPGPADVATARAVAALDRLAAWCLPLVTEGGRVLALKGDLADQEVVEHKDRIVALGGSEPIVRRCGVGVIDPPTTVVDVVRQRVVQRGRPRSNRRSRR
jgi:16S rRNA (guanine527-N7)-methyltransferase